MCVPIVGAALGAAASVAGGVMKAQQQQAYTDALNRSRMEAFNIARVARNKEDRRQEDFSDRSFKKLNKTRKKVDAESQIADMATAKEQFITENPTDPGFDALSGAVDTGAGNAATTAEKAQTIADAAAKSKASLANLAGLSSFGSVSSGVGKRLQKNADILSLLNNMRQGSLGVYQQEASIQPEQINPPDTTMADMLTGFGGLFNRGGGGAYG